jgi:chemotaxis protein MotB
MRSNRINKAIPEQDAGTFNLSISDLMAGLLAIFILALSYFMLNFSKATAQLTQNNVKRSEILLVIKGEMKKGGIDVKIDEKHGILRIPEGVLFDVAKADIKPEGQVVITKLSDILLNVLSGDEYKDYVETVFIEGHTDNVPIENSEYPSNWELSTKRAINTWLVMQGYRPELNNLMNRNGQPIFSCSGYAETRPVSDNALEEGKRENRRIDLRFTMSPPSEEDQEIIKFVKKRLKEQ